MESIQQEIRDEILSITSERGASSSVCPSLVARNLFPDDWRDQMDLVREVAFDLVEEGHIRVTQNGEPVDSTDVSGPIRLQAVENLAE